MKKLIGVMLALLILLSGCSNSNKYVGVWKNESCREAALPPDWIDTNGKCTLIINEDGTGTLTISNVIFSHYNGEHDFTWELTDGGTCKLVCNDISSAFFVMSTDESSGQLDIWGSFKGWIEFHHCTKQ